LRPLVARVELADLDPSPHRRETLRWWDAIWCSPVRVEWDASDITGGLLPIAALLDRFYSEHRKRNGQLGREIAASMREYGLTPRSRFALLRTARGLPPIPRAPSPESEP
jgi:hypothetical protein